MDAVLFNYHGFSVFIDTVKDYEEVKIKDTTPKKVTLDNWKVEHQKAIERDMVSDYYKDNKNYRMEDLEDGSHLRDGKTVVVLDEKGFYFGKINYVIHNDEHRFMYLYVCGDRRDDFYRKGIKDYERSCFIMWRIALIISLGRVVIPLPRLSVIKYLKQMNAKFYKAKEGNLFDDLILTEYDNTVEVERNHEIRKYSEDDPDNEYEVVAVLQF
jgi:hypothetical protein